MKNFRRPAIIVFIVLAALWVIPFLIPMGSYIHRIETMAKDHLGVPISIGSLHLALLPTPRVNASEVTVGDDQALTVGHVAIVPDITSIFSDVKAVSVIKIDSPVIKKSALTIVDKLKAGTDKAPSSDTQVVVRKIVLNKVKLDWPEMALPEFDAVLQMTQGNKPEHAEISTTDGHLKATLQPQGDTQSIVVQAERWQVPVGPPFMLDKLTMEMTLKAESLEIPKIDIDLYDGKLTGQAALHWAKTWQLKGTVNVDHLAVKDAVTAVSKGTRLTGKLFGDGSYHATAKTPAGLADVLQADFRFRVDNGVLYGLDLAKAASMLLSSGHQGGETRFDALSGVVKVSGKQYHLQQLKVVSGLLTATGQVKVLPSQQLDGVIDVDLKKGVSLATIPLQVSGTVSKPAVFPTKAAMAGAVAGTAVLGPGVGTTLGVKAGSAIDKIKGLFGGDDK